MTVVLPASLPASSGWTLVDFRDVRAQAIVDPAGVATIELEQLAGDVTWLVDHAVVACASAAGSQMRLYASVVSDRTLLDGTSRGDFDVADWPAGLRVGPVTALIAQWTGATPGATATIALQVRVLRKG